MFHNLSRSSFILRILEFSQLINDKIHNRFFGIMKVVKILKILIIKLWSVPLLLFSKLSFLKHFLFISQIFLFVGV